MTVINKIYYKKGATGFTIENVWDISRLVEFNEKSNKEKFEF